MLDPRYKLKYCFETVYDAETVAKIVVKVEQILQRLYNSYNVEGESDGDKVSCRFFIYYDLFIYVCYTQISSCSINDLES